MDADDNLPSIFDKVLSNYEEVENSSLSSASSEYQSVVKCGAVLCEKGIQMVNALHLFSDNEDLDELSSNEVKYLFLPALLGYFTNRRTDGCRYDLVKMAELFYRDFFKLCTNYKVQDVPFPSDVTSAQGETSRGVQSQAAMEEERNAKVRRYKEQKALDGRLAELKAYVSQEHVDEEVKRKFYLSLVQRWAYTAFEEIATIAKELPLLEMMKNRESNQSSSVEMRAKPAPSKPPFRPFILTRSDLEKQVYGAGYPSLPTMTLDEFYEMQVKQGILPPPVAASVSATVGTGIARRIEPEVDHEAEDRKAGEEEEREARDDEEYLKKKRDWDDFKDDNRRGDGNRKNKG